MSGPELLSLERDNGVHTITIRWPEVRNALDHEAIIQAEVIGSDDFREGLAATRQERHPTFKGH